MAITWGSAGVFGTIGKAIKVYNQTSIKEKSSQAEAVKFVQAYLKYIYPPISGSTYKTLAALLDVLYDDMTNDSQTVDGNAVSAGAVTFNGSGSLHIDDAAGVYGQVTPTQLLENGDIFRIECTRASTGADTWRLYSMWNGLISDVVTTGTLQCRGAIFHYYATGDRIHKRWRRHTRSDKYLNLRRGERHQLRFVRQGLCLCRR